MWGSSYPLLNDKGGALKNGHGKAAVSSSCSGNIGHQSSKEQEEAEVGSGVQRAGLWVLQK